MKNFANLPELIAFQFENFNQKKALNFKENGSWIHFSNSDFFTKVNFFAAGLEKIGFCRGEIVAIFSYQNPYWLIADFGCMLAGAVTVPIFHNISEENFDFEIFDSKTKYIFTDNQEFAQKFLTKNLSVKLITKGFKLENCYNFDEIIDLGSDAKKDDFMHRCSLIKNQDLATIIYTSGSSGTPKGVELSHNNLISQIKDTAEFFPLKNDDIVLSFLPLAHIFERMVMMFYISQGVQIYFVDDIKNLGAFLREVKPTLMTVVPRVLEKLYGKICEGVDGSNFIKKFIAKIALNSALKRSVDLKIGLKERFLELLIYRKFRGAIGGKIRMIICGGSSLSVDMERFYRNIGINLFCGYGLTEASPVLAANCQKYYKFGTVGKNFPSVKLKIAKDGELLASGPNIMLGYHNAAEKNDEIIVDGWLKTGDLAEIDGDGFVKIVGRKKELFKTANGKYVSPVFIEQKLVQNLGFLIGAIIIAEGRRFVSAIIFPDFESLKKIKTKFSFSGDDLTFLRSGFLQKFVELKINEINRAFDHWQQIQKFHIATEEISIERGEITPSMKLRRNVLEKKYASIIEDFYHENLPNSTINS